VQSVLIDGGAEQERLERFAGKKRCPCIEQKIGAAAASRSRAIIPPEAA